MIAWGYEKEKYLLLKNKNISEYTPLGMICSSFAFIPLGSGLPGFFESPITISTAPIWCKDWTAVSVNLDGLAGKKIRLFFKTADCTFRRHFGYAYIDVNSECNSEFVGATYCPDDTAVVVNLMIWVFKYNCIIIDQRILILICWYCEFIRKAYCFCFR